VVGFGGKTRALALDQHLGAGQLRAHAYPHDGSYVSGVYYIQTAPECGRLCFETLSDNLWASARLQRENWNAVNFEPVERRMVLFNSQIPHYVSQNMSQIERIALSFNVAVE
jgi:uncharacterized protein (TIGR02466 family)